MRRSDFGEGVAGAGRGDRARGAKTQAGGRARGLALALEPPPLSRRRPVRPRRRPRRDPSSAGSRVGRAHRRTFSAVGRKTRRSGLQGAAGVRGQSRARTALRAPQIRALPRAPRPAEPGNWGSERAGGWAGPPTAASAPERGRGGARTKGRGRSGRPARRGNASQRSARGSAARGARGRTWVLFRSGPAGRLRKCRGSASRARGGVGTAASCACAHGSVCV